MSDALRKGWCPGALRPMMARDGLLVRLRLTGGRLDADRARALAALAAFYGNGLVDLSARANLQLRGVGEAQLQPLLDALADLDMLDADPAGEAVRNVLASPLAGCPGRFDIGSIVAALEARLAGDPALHALPGKFGFLVDDGGAAGLAAEAADVRFDITVEGAPRAWIGLGGTRDNAVSLGYCAPEAIVETAAAIARTFLALAPSHEPPARRMGTLVTRLSPYQAARAFGGGSDARPPYAGAIFSRSPVGPFEAEGVSVVGLAVPFGRLDHAMLRAAADLADARGGGELRLTPWRSILIPGLRAPPDRAACRAAGFIVDPDHPQLRVAACVGMDGCERGTTPTRADALGLLDAAIGIGGTGPAIHVSGCAKGCAKASRTPFTLVGRDGRYDLVHNGTAGDAPARRDLDLAAARKAILATRPAAKVSA